MLQAYKEEKNKILKQYDKLLSFEGLFPIEALTSSQKSIALENIIEKKKQLEEEHFFVSFTGQIKAGKSTLINALLFGEEIIPADDTPHTAKITIIKYGQTPKLEATFYNKNEWGVFKENQEFYNEFLKPDIEQSIANGIYVEEVIQSTAKHQKEESLDNLADYVARDGKYTPFVNFVTLYYPNEMLKELTIVDTPGTNDPNKLRDKVAKEWIDKTNANIYISYAGQAMDKVDIDFIDNFLLSVPKEQKLTVLNKIDTVNGTDGLNDYIDELFTDDSLKKREILTTKENLVLVSGLGALIDKMLTQELELSDDLSYYAEQLDEEGFLEPQKHGLKKFEEMIEQKLIENKGQNIIEGHRQMITSIFEKKIQMLTQNLEVEKSCLRDLSKSEKELEDSKKSINEIIKFIGIESANLEKEWTDFIKNEIDEFHLFIIRQKNDNKKYIQKEITSINNTSNYQNEIQWIVKDALDNNYNDLKNHIVEVTERLSNTLTEEMKNLQYRLLEKDKSTVLNIVSSTFNIYSTELTCGMKELATKTFEKNSVNKLVEENSNFFQRMFDTPEGLSQINKAIKSDINEFLEESSGRMKEQFENELEKHILEKILREVTQELDTLLENKKMEIQSNLKNKDDKTKLISESKENKKLLEEKIEKIKKYYEEIK